MNEKRERAIYSPQNDSGTQKLPPPPPPPVAAHLLSLFFFSPWLIRYWSNRIPQSQSFDHDFALSLGLIKFAEYQFQRINNADEKEETRVNIFIHSSLWSQVTFSK